MKKFSKIFLFLALLGATSCSLLGNKSKLDSLESGSKLDLRKFFLGDLEGFSIAQDGGEKIIDTGSIKISAKWGDSSHGTILQEITDSSGKKESRTWLITLNDDGTFDAVGHDLVGSASGYQIGNAAEMTYVLSSLENGKKVKTKFRDRMYLADDRSMILISETYRGFAKVGQKITSLKKVSKSEKYESRVAQPKVEAKSEAVKPPVKQQDDPEKNDANSN